MLTCAHPSPPRTATPPSPRGPRPRPDQTASARRVSCVCFCLVGTMRRLSLVRLLHMRAPTRAPGVLHRWCFFYRPPLLVPPAIEHMQRQASRQERQPAFASHRTSSARRASTLCRSSLMTWPTRCPHTCAQSSTPPSSSCKKVGHRWLLVYCCCAPPH